MKNTNDNPPGPHPTKLADRVNLWLRQNWPYLVFVCLVTIYNSIYLPLGFRPSLDEGYLQSLANRVLDGELPYRDFYFFRTPLSVYLQAAMIALLGDHYTLLAARIFCVVQTASMAILVSLVYRTLVNKFELLALMIASYLISTLMLDFPWYSYDAAFFATVGLVMFHQRRFFLFGLAVFAAGLCKQNYAGLLILLPLVSGLGYLLNREMILGSLKEIARFFAGFAVAGLFYLGFLLATSRVGDFIQNIIFLPRECSSMSLSFALFQNHGDAFLKSLALIFLVIFLFYANRDRKLLFAGAGIVGIVFVKGVWNATYDFSYAMVYLTYTVAILIVLRLTDKGRSQLSTESGPNTLLRTFLFAVIIQYLAGGNYGGLIFSHIGAGVAVPLAFVLMFRLKSTLGAKLPVYLLLVGVLVTGFHLKQKYIYHDAPTDQLTREFSHPKLSGIYSSDENVRIFEEILATVDRYTEPGDPIFTFPNHPSLYFITGRRNPTPVQWYYPPEYNDEIMREAVESLKALPPKLIFTRPSLTPEILAEFIELEYRKVDHLGQLDVLVYKGSTSSD